MSFLTSGGFSAPARCTSRSTHPEQYSAEAPMDLTWCDQSIRSRMLPGQADVADEWASQPQLPARACDQPAPTIGCLRVARSNGGPAEGLLEETEGVLDSEAPQVPAPQDAQVSRQRTADPGQPQGPRRQLFVGQALDLDADHAEGRIRRAADVEPGPDVDADDAIRRVVQLSRSLGLAVGGFVGQPKRLTMQPWPTTAELPFGGAIHHPLPGQAHQQVSVHVSDG